MKLDPIKTFLEVSRAQSFTAAAKRLGIPRSTVSSQMQNLEASLGVRLLKRSTRSIALTQEGRDLFAQTEKPVAEVINAIEQTRNRSEELQGLIRVTAPADMPAEWLAESATEFSVNFPKIEFQFLVTNENIDLIVENVDIAIRIGGDDKLETIKRKLYEIEWGFLASRKWLAHNQRPQTLTDITSFVSPPKKLRRYIERFVLNVAPLPPSSIETDSQMLALDLVKAGFGVGLLPVGLCERFVKNRQLTQILPDIHLCRTTVDITFPTRADMVPRVRSFADFLIKKSQSD